MEKKIYHGNISKRRKKINIGEMGIRSKKERKAYETLQGCPTHCLWATHPQGDYECSLTQNHKFIENLYFFHQFSLVFV